MKKHTLNKIMSLIETKTALAKLDYQDVIKRQKRELHQAETLMQQAHETGLAPATTAAALHSGQMLSAQLIAKSNRRSNAAASLDPAINISQDIVKQALKRELAWAKLVEKAGIKERKERNDRDETAREHATILRPD